MESKIIAFLIMSKKLWIINLLFYLQMHYHILSNNKIIDILYYYQDITPEQIRASLIHEQGYTPDIQVKPVVPIQPIQPIQPIT